MARRTSFIKKIHNFFEKNPSQIQFWLTIIALGFTIWYSSQSIKSIDDQLNLAKEQFDSLKVANKRNDSITHLKDIQATAQYIKDTIRMSKRDGFQVKSFMQQLKVNEQQFLAIKTQADIAMKQYIFQSMINDQQIYNNRPVFFVNNVTCDTSKNVVNAEFDIVNMGKRVAKVEKMNLILWNEHNAYFQQSVTNGSMDLNPDRANSIYARFITYKEEFIDNQTLYYLTIFYRDLNPKKVKIFKRLFRWTRTPEKQFVWNSISTVDSSMFEKIIAKKNIHPNLYNN